MKNHKIQKLFSIGLMSILCINLVTGCKFNTNASKDVDNSVKNTEIRDNMSETESISVDGTGAIDEVMSEMIAQEETVYAGPKISIVMVGDMLMHTPVEESAIQEDGSYSYVL